MHIRRLRYASLAFLVATILTAGCSSTETGLEVWTGTSTLDDGTTRSLRLEVRDVEGDLVGDYDSGAAHGTFEGRVEGTSLTATLTPSATCTYALAGTASDGTIEATFEPDACPGGERGTWTLERS